MMKESSAKVILILLFSHLGQFPDENFWKIIKSGKCMDYL